MTYNLANNHWLGLVTGRLGITSSNLWHRETIVDAGMWKEEQKSSQEYELMYRILKQLDNVILDDEPLSIIRRRENSISTTNSYANRERAALLHTEMFDYVLNTYPETVKDYDVAFYHAVLKYLSILALFDSSKAKIHYQDWIPNDFLITEPSFGRFYRFCFNTFGFDIAQALFKPYLYCRELLFFAK